MNPHSDAISVSPPVLILGRVSPIRCFSRLLAARQLLLCGHDSFAIDVSISPVLDEPTIVLARFRAVTLALADLTQEVQTSHVVFVAIDLLVTAVQHRSGHDWKCRPASRVACGFANSLRETAKR
jgi:hypothetical protein